MKSLIEKLNKACEWPKKITEGIVSEGISFDHDITKVMIPVSTSLDGYGAGTNDGIRDGSVSGKILSAGMYHFVLTDRAKKILEEEGIEIPEIPEKPEWLVDMEYEYNRGCRRFWLSKDGREYRCVPDRGRQIVISKEKFEKTDLFELLRLDGIF